jgi:hypothetical protein
LNPLVWRLVDMKAICNLLAENRNSLLQYCVNIMRNEHKRRNVIKLFLLRTYLLVRIRLLSIFKYGSILPSDSFAHFDFRDR